MKHSRTLDERKELDRRSKERKAGRSRRSRSTEHQDWVEQGDEAAAFERIPRSPEFHGAQGVPRSAHPSPSRSPGDAEVPEDSRATENSRAACVVSCAPGRARVLQGGVEREAVLSEAIAQAQQTLLAVGDEVLLEERDGALPRVCVVLPRRSLISRPDPSRPHRERVLAANIDRAVIVVAVRRPAFRQRLIDRYLIAVQRGGVEAIVCANKADLVPGEDEREELKTHLENYRAIGVPAFLTSGVTGEGVDTLRALLVGCSVVFLGQSGVGKSSLMNALAPELGLATGEVREGDGKGRHVTTRSLLVDLGNGTRLIDTPGIRSLGLSDVTQATLPGYFPELVALQGGCRFRDCSHVREPDCAVRGALERGELPRPRYDTYVRILESL